jgi:hypothetical protein
MSAKLRSKALRPDVPQYYMRRVFLKSVGATDADLEKPLVAIGIHGASRTSVSRIALPSSFYETATSIILLPE